MVCLFSVVTNNFCVYFFLFLVHPDKVNEPVKYLKTMMEQQEDINIRDDNNKSCLLSPSSSYLRHQCKQQCIHQQHSQHVLQEICSTASCSGFESDRLRLPASLASDTSITIANNHQATRACEQVESYIFDSLSTQTWTPANQSKPVNALLLNLVPSFSSLVTSSITSSFLITILLLCTFMLHTAGK